LSTAVSVELSGESVEISNKQTRYTMKTGKHCSVIVLIAVTFLAASTQAQDRFWSAGSGDWSNAANWGGDVPDSSVERAYFAGVGNAINMDADFLAGAIRANFGAQGGTNTLSGPKTLTINGNAANVLGFANQAGGSGGTMILNGNMVVNNTPGGVNNFTQVRNDNSAGNATVFDTGSILTLNTPLVTLSGIGGTISFNGTLASSASYLAIQANNVSFGAGHNSSSFGQNIAFWGSDRKLTVDGGTVLAPGRKFSIQGTGSELELNGANAINGANIDVLSTHNFLLDVNSDQLTMGSISLGTGVLTIDLDAGVSDLFFADSSGATWNGGTVAINGFQEGVIRFGTDASGLTAGQLAAIDGGLYSLSGQGYLTLVPEPTTTALLLFSGMGLLAARRMRV
jgi:hypothetical protein